MFLFSSKLVVRAFRSGCYTGLLTRSDQVSGTRVLHRLLSGIRPVSVMAEKIQKFRVKGLMCPPCTPLTADGELNTDIIPQYVQHHLDFGIKNIFLNGTTGEGLNLTVSERKKLTEAWISAGKGKLDTILIHIGAINLKDSQELAAHAEQCGADGIACVVPSYYKPTTIDDYVEYMRQVASAAPTLPFYLYDIDFFTGVYFSMDEFFKMAIPKIPTLRGLKHTSPSFPSMNTLLMKYPDMEVFLGSDEFYLEGLAIGIDITICSSFFGNVLNRTKAAFDKGDLATARLEQNRALQVCNIIRRKHGLSVPGGAKAVLRALGLNVGSTRLPLANIPDTTVNQVKQELQEIGFFEWATKP